MSQPHPLATVEVVSAWASKINWVQAVGIMASLVAVLSGNHFNIDVLTQAQIVLGINTVQGLLTVLLKTWFTPTITPSSVSATPDHQPPILQTPLKP